MHDNGIYILKTLSTAITKDGWREDCEAYPVWRVAHAQCIENFDFFEEEQPYNVGAYLQALWGRSPVFLDSNEAFVFAQKVEKKLKGTAHGVNVIDTEYIFFGDD